MAKRLSQKSSARLMRQAVAFDRLAAKALRANNDAAYSLYTRKSIDLRGRSSRLKQKGL